ncbi:MAG: hypothetical protein M3527_08990 [Actinomycetota bacterium]|nr:hypothetical protein [Acidimicrobiia bacterium]MDQ3294567.1 hypothetical protein [Actinomycetota bacterium]
MPDDDQPIEPQTIQLHTEAPFGASQSYDSQWISWAQSTPAPQIAGVDASLDPRFSNDPNDPNGDSGTRYA